MLFCQEILLEIFAYLSPGWFQWSFCDHYLRSPDMEKALKPRRLLQGTLAACARTCHAFSDLALAELWRVLDHHVFLLKVLPWRLSDDSLFDEVLVRIFMYLWTSSFLSKTWNRIWSLT